MKKINKNKKVEKKITPLAVLIVLLTLSSCKNEVKDPVKKNVVKTVYASDVIPFFDN